MTETNLGTATGPDGEQWPVISRYTDEEACEDGMLVKLNRADRVTRTAWEWMSRHLPEEQPPDRWPVDLMGWIGAKHAEQPGDTRALAASKGIIEQERRHTMREGRRSVFARRGEGGIILGLNEQVPDDNDQELRLAANENGGLTLMLPEDD